MRLSGRYFWILGFALALLLAACGGQGGQSGPSAKVGVASSVTPIPYIPWQAGSAETECAQAGIPFDGAYKVDPPTSGTYNVDAYGHYVTVSFSQDGRYVDWSSNLAISAVIVKGGPNANVYI